MGERNRSLDQEQVSWLLVAGSTANLILQLLKQEKLSSDEIKELKRLAGEKTVDSDENTPSSTDTNSLE